MSVTARAATLQLLFHLLNPLPITPHNVSYMSYPVKIDLQLINLPQYVVKSRNLGVCNLDRIACPVVLLLCHHLGLLGEVFQSC